MIVGIQGIIEATGPDWVHLRIGGVTLQVSVPATAISDLGPTGSQAACSPICESATTNPCCTGFRTPPPWSSSKSCWQYPELGPVCPCAHLQPGRCGRAASNNRWRRGRPQHRNWRGPAHRRSPGVGTQGQTGIGFHSCRRPVSRQRYRGRRRANGPGLLRQRSPTSGGNLTLSRPDGRGPHSPGLAAVWGRGIATAQEHVQNGKFFVPTTGMEDWQELLADPKKQWRSGYSAKALACCWEEAGGFPKSVKRVFSQSELELFKG